MKFALLIIDLQKAYYRGEAVESMELACEYINEMIPRFRKAGCPVIWIQDEDRESGVVPGTEGYDLIDVLKPGKKDYRVNKTYSNSFNKTDLVEILRKEGVDTPVLSGYAAEFCVLSTYRGAKDLDLTPVLLKGGIASGRKDAVSFVSSISETISYGILSKVLEA